MRLLLDTHAFLWFINGDEKLNQHSRALIQESNNEVFLVPTLDRGNKVKKFINYFALLLLYEKICCE